MEPLQAKQMLQSLAAQPETVAPRRLELLQNILEFFPYPIHVYAPDGTLELTNRAFLHLFNIPSPGNIVGRYNVLHDPVIEKWGIREHVLRSFHGETVQLENIRAPLPEIQTQFGERELAFSSLFQNIAAYPVYTEGESNPHVVTIFFTAKTYTDKQTIATAKEYLEQHWLEDFDLDIVASAVHLSRYHFARLFKKHAAVTPHEYYQQIKLRHLKETLLDTRLTIAQAYSRCNMEYSGHFARLFREKVGMTPSQYRKDHLG